MTRQLQSLMGSGAIRSWCLLAGVVLALSSVGCEQTARGLTINETTAREACTTFLTAWKDGKKAADLAPKIVGKDADWEFGKMLLSFEILPQERTDGANLFLKVRQTIKSVKGVERQQEVEYVVGTSPVVTVFRCDQ